MMEQLTQVTAQIAKEVVAELVESFMDEMIAQGIDDDWADEIMRGALERFEQAHKLNSPAPPVATKKRKRVTKRK